MKFTGHERDGNEAGTTDDLDYMHARYYSPHLARFLSTDPARESADPKRPQSWNRYAYVMGNPVVYVDPDGKNPFDYSWLVDLFRPDAHPIHDTGKALARNGDSMALLGFGFAGAAKALGAGGIGFRISATLATRSLLVRTAPVVSSPALQRVVSQLFKPSDRFAGGTAGAIRVEAATGRMLSRSSTGHLQAGLERLGNLRRVVQSGNLNAQDLATAAKLERDLTGALKQALDRFGYSAAKAAEAISNARLPVE